MTMPAAHTEPSTAPGGSLDLRVRRLWALYGLIATAVVVALGGGGDRLLGDGRRRPSPLRGRCYRRPRSAS